MKNKMLTEQEIEKTIIDLRRSFHQEPELSGKEQETAKKIIAFLESLGLKVQTFQQHYGVGAVIEGGQPGPVIALRADMDALPILEEAEVSYQSINQGVMHACGHDAHMAILLGTAIRLLQNKSQLRGKVKLVFQPAEELSPQGGAKEFLAGGFLDDVQAIFGLHVWPELETGQVGIKAGPLMAASDRFKVKILGKGAHAAHPHQGVDAIMIGADIIQDFSHIISRQINPISAATLSIGSIHGGERYNVIAREVFLEGTVRTLDEKTRLEIPCHMENALAGVEKAYDAKCEFDYQRGYPVLNNWREPAMVVQEAAHKILGIDSVPIDIKPELTAEDFAVYLKKIPGAFFWLGCHKQGDEDRALHNANFILDEEALTIGSRLLFEISKQMLEKISNDISLANKGNKA